MFKGINNFTRIYNAYILFIICIIPLIVNPWDETIYTHTRIMFIYIITFLMLTIRFIFSGNEKNKISIYDYFIFGYLILVLISTLFSVNINQALLGAEYREEGFAAICCYVIIYYVSSNYYTFKKKHIMFLLFSSSIIAIYAIVERFGFNYFTIRSGWPSQLSTIGNQNFLGSYITLMLPISLFCFAYTKRYMYLVWSSILFLCMLCTETRSAWIAFIVYFLILIFYIIKFKIGCRHFLLWIIPVFMIITITYNIFNGNQITRRFFSIKSDTISTITNASDSSGSYRVFIWKRAVTLIQLKPILGSGPDTFDIVFMKKYFNDVQQAWGVQPKVGDKKTNDYIILDKAHNEYLQIAITTGIPSLMFYIAFIIILLVKGYKKLDKNIFVIPIFCSVVGYVVQAFFNISVVQVAPVYWAMLGLLVNFVEGRSNFKLS